MNNQKSSLVDALELRAINGLNTPPDLFFRLRNSDKAGKLIIFKDQLNRPIAYLAFADVNKESALRFLKKGSIPFYPYEWNEGGIFLIIDVVIQKESSFDAVRQIKNIVLSKRAIIFSRGNKCKFYLKKNGTLIQRKFSK